MITLELDEVEMVEAGVFEAAVHVVLDVVGGVDIVEQEAGAFKPTLIYLDEHNRIKDTRKAIPVQVA